MNHREYLRQWADVFARAIDTPMTGAAVPTTPEALHDFARRLRKLVDGATKAKAFERAKPVGRPTALARAIAYRRFKLDGMTNDKAAKAAIKQHSTRDRPGPTPQSVIDHARKHRDEIDHALLLDESDFIDLT